MSSAYLQCLVNETFSRLDALSPFRPAAIVQTPLLCRVSSFSQGGINNGCGNSCATAADDRYVRLYAL